MTKITSLCIYELWVFTKPQLQLQQFYIGMDIFKIVCHLFKY